MSTQGEASGGSSEAGSGRVRMRVASATRALKHRNYRLFFGGQLVSLIGTWMQSVAQAWLVYRLTGSAAMLGLIGFAGQIPVFLLSPVGGATADRYNRHNILVVTQAVSMALALTLAALTLTGVVEIWHLFVLASLMGCVNGFDIPTRQSFVMEMVGREDLVNAIALNSSMFNGARVVGPAIAGVLVAAVGEGWCFLLNGVSYVAVIAGLLMMHVTPREIVHSGHSMFRHIAEGFRYVARTAPIRDLIIVLGLISLLGAPYAVLMPVFADKVLGGGPQALGILMGATGVGAVTGALVLAARTRLAGLGGWVAAASLLFGVALVAFSLSRTFWLSVVLLIPAGMGFMVQMAGTNTLLQSMVPDVLRGRVMSFHAMMFMGATPLGALLAGVVSAQLGAPTTVAAGGALVVLTSLAFRLRLPALRAEARELIAAHQHPPASVEEGGVV